MKAITLKRIKAGICWRIYQYLAMYLPCSWHKGGRFAKWLRAYCCKTFCRYVGKNVNIEHLAHLETTMLSIGDNSGIGVNCWVHGDLTIGDNVMMGHDCIFYTSNHEFHSLEIPMCQQGHQAEKPIKIGSDVWIGGRVIFLPGVNVGNGAIIGAGSIVTKDIPDYAIAVGNPAVVKKFRK